MHVLSPLYHPELNGQAKWLAGTFKWALLKTKGKRNPDEILHTLLLLYRTTPNGVVETSVTSRDTRGMKTLYHSAHIMTPMTKATAKP